MIMKKKRVQEMTIMMMTIYIKISKSFYQTSMKFTNKVQ